MLPDSSNSKSKSKPKTKRSTTGASVTKRKRRFETQARTPRSGKKIRKDTSKALNIEHGDEESDEDKDTSASKVESNFNLHAGRWGLLDDELPENQPFPEPEPPKKHAQDKDPRKAKEEESIWALLTSLQATAVASAEYIHWSQKCVRFFIDTTNTAPFPMPSSSMSKACGKKGCVRSEKLGACACDVERLLKGSGTWGTEGWLAWLKRERLRWHPDKLVGRDEGQELAAEMFRFLQRLVDVEEGNGGR